MKYAIVKHGFSKYDQNTDTYSCCESFFVTTTDSANAICSLHHDSDDMFIGVKEFDSYTAAVSVCNALLTK